MACPCTYEPVNTTSYACGKLSNSFRYFYNPPCFSYGMCWNIWKKQKTKKKKVEKNRKDSNKSCENKRVDNIVRQYPLLDSVCRVFLFSYSCGWFSSIACPVFLPTICVSCCQLAFVQRRGLRQRREERARSPADLCDGTPVQRQQSRKAGKAFHAWDANLRSWSLAPGTVDHYSIRPCLSSERLDENAAVLKYFFFFFLGENGKFGFFRYFTLSLANCQK